MCCGDLNYGPGPELSVDLCTSHVDKDYPVIRVWHMLSARTRHKACEVVELCQASPQLPTGGRKLVRSPARLAKSLEAKCIAAQVSKRELFYTSSDSASADLELFSVQCWTCNSIVVTASMSSGTVI